MIDKLNWMQHAPNENDLNHLLNKVQSKNEAVFMKICVAFKEIFIEGLTDQLFHLGKSSTCHVEGVHAVSKARE